MGQLDWSKFRKRQALLLSLLLGFPVAMVCASIVSHVLLDSEFLVWPMAICWMVGYGTAGYLLSHFPCPRCGRTFFYRNWIYNPLANRCEHCDWAFGQNYNASNDQPYDSAPAEVETIHCLDCGQHIAPNSDVCPQCGWSYEPSKSISIE